MLIVRAGVAPGRQADLRIEGGTVTAVAPSLAPRAGDDVLDAAGAAVVPGLHDHHVHLRALAAAEASVDLHGVGDADDLVARLRDAQHRRRPGTWVRVVGYHEAIAGPLDRTWLDAVTVTDTPIRVQHRSGAVWVLNSAGLAAAGVDSTASSDTVPGVDPVTGWVWRGDEAVRHRWAADAVDLAPVGAAGAALGVTGFTDATPGAGPDHALELGRDLRAAGVPQTLHLMGPVGAAAPDVPRARLGPVKVLLDDDDLPPFDTLAATVRAAHEEGRPVAVHCVTDVQLVFALAALDAAGAVPGDRIEHGAVIPHDLLPDLADLRVTVVTQPNFVAERGDDYRRDVPPEDHEALYRLASLDRAGVGVAAGTDAPFGRPDPWAAMAAAVDRRTASGERLGADETVDVARALALFLGRPDAPAVPRILLPGTPADIAVLAVPWPALGAALRDRPVRATIIAGEVVHLAG